MARELLIVRVADTVFEDSVQATDWRFVPLFLVQVIPDKRVIYEGTVNVTTLPVYKGQFTVIDINNFVLEPVAPLMLLDKEGVKVVNGDSVVMVTVTAVFTY